MSYMWNEFNIKTLRAETIVYRDGVFCQDLSTLSNTHIDKTYKLPVHIIYVGKIAGENALNIDILADNQPVVLSVRVKNKKPAFLNIFIKNTGKNSELRGNVFLNNHSELKYNCFAGHFAENTGILVKTKLLAEKDSISELTGTAEIKPGCTDVNSDISFSAMADRGAKIKFIPVQRICAVPNAADHSASIYKPTDFQIQYLRAAGLGGGEVDAALRDAFMTEL